MKKNSIYKTLVMLAWIIFFALFAIADKKESLKIQQDTTKADTAKVEITQSILMQQMKKHNEKIDSLIQEKKTKK